MCGSCALKCFNATEVEHIKLHGISEENETIDNVTESAIKKYIEEQSDESKERE